MPPVYALSWPYARNPDQMMMVPCQMMIPLHSLPQAALLRSAAHALPPMKRAAPFPFQQSLRAACNNACVRALKLRDGWWRVGVAGTCASPALVGCHEPRPFSESREPCVEKQEGCGTAAPRFRFP